MKKSIKIVLLLIVGLGLIIYNSKGLKLCKEELSKEKVLVDFLQPLKIKTI